MIDPVQAKAIRLILAGCPVPDIVERKLRAVEPSK